MSDITNRAADLAFSQMGLKGGILVTDTTAITGVFVGIKVLQDAVFTTLTTPGFTKNGTSTACAGADWSTLPTGEEIPMKITACTLTSGKVMLYK